MTKQEEFLWGVQTLVLLDSTNLAISPDALVNRHEIPATGRFGDVMGAIEASRQLPNQMTVEDAIHEFYYWRCARYSDNDVDNKRPPRPVWLHSVK